MFSISLTFCFTKLGNYLAKLNPGYWVMIREWVLFDFAMFVWVKLKTFNLIFFHITIVGGPLLIDCVSPCHAILRMHGV